ncbi:MAG: cobalamin-binding protein [Chloroflexota bacterium]|nr:cobalamin-binding protein [Dehalococcoidia bacterium]MDW8253402.1 cobalamin-binding protein [Chloroflexota bacterium]
MVPQRIVSLLPSATEIVYALGLGDRLVAVTHECDYPEAAATKPRATYSLVKHESLTALEIDIAVRDALQNEGTLYDLDRALLETLRPDLILTQQVCDVCAVSFDRVCVAAPSFGDPQIVSLNPHHLHDVLDNILLVGRVTGTEERACALVDEAYRRIGRVATIAAGLRVRPRTVVLEWLDPPYRAGHWTPEIVHLAGGDDHVGRPGQDATVVDWQEVLAFAPEVIIIAQCGFDLARSMTEARRVRWPAGWEAVPAVRAGRVYVVDGNSYLSRPGPRIVDSLELVAEILHPEAFAGLAPAGSYCRLTF